MFNLLRKSLFLKMLILVSACFLFYYYSYDKKPEVESKTEEIRMAAKNSIKKNIPNVSEKNKVNSLKRINDSVNSKVNATARVLRINEDQYQGMKEDYFCDLAITARENCELQIRSEESMEICLKMGGYFTNSRHCGYQP